MWYVEKGPSPAQAEVLVSLGKKPEDFAHMTREDVTRVMQGMMPLKRSSNSQGVKDTFLQKRLDAIQKKGLRVGMLVCVEKGMVRGKPKKILEISPAGFVRIEESKRAYAPQSIVPA